MDIALTTINSKYIHPNLALRILRNDLNNHRVDSTLLEYTLKQDNEIIVEELLKYDIICWSCYIYNIEKIKLINKKLLELKPSLIIILGGPEVSYVSQEEAELLDFDYIVCGEGEQELVKLVNSLISNTNYQSNYIIHKQENDLIMNSDVNRVSIEYAQTLTNDFSDLDLVNQIIYLETSRGCPYRCAYCQASLDNDVRNFSLEYIFNIIDDIYEKEVRLVKFLDRTFNFDTKRTNEILEYIIEKDTAKTTFQLEVTGELLADSSIEIINKKARSNLFRMEIGIQSTNTKANRAIRRYQDFNKLKEIILSLKKENKVVLHLDLIAGLPYEDLASFKKTFNDVFETRPQELQLGFLKILKGTYLNQLIDEYRYVFEEEAPYEIISNKFLSIEDLNVIRYVEVGLEEMNNHRKGLLLLNHLIEKYQYDYFELFYELGKLIINEKQKHDLYHKILDSRLIKDDEDRIVLFDNYFYQVKQRNKALTKVENKKDILHQLIEKQGLIQNEIFTQACVEKINDDYYYVYLLKKQISYQIKKDR